MITIQIQLSLYLKKHMRLYKQNKSKITQIMPHVLLQMLIRKSENHSLLNLTEMQQLSGLWPALQMLTPLIYNFTYTQH